MEWGTNWNSANSILNGSVPLSAGQHTLSQSASCGFILSCASVPAVYGFHGTTAGDFMTMEYNFGRGFIPFGAIRGLFDSLCCSGLLIFAFSKTIRLLLMSAQQTVRSLETRWLPFLVFRFTNTMVIRGCTSLPLPILNLGQIPLSLFELQLQHLVLSTFT